MAGTTRKSLITRLRGYDTQHTRATTRYANQIATIYNEAAKEFAQLAAGLNFDPDKPFTFADYPQANKRAAQILADMTRRVRQVVETGTTAEWARANARADEYLFSILQRGKLTPQELAQYADRNLEALKAFQTRTTNGLNLSDRVWRINRQFNGQMELAIDVALGDGRSAAELSRDVRGLLNQPDKLFRRVRDKYGNLQLSRAAALYHPGRGVYRSSAMNAMRLARTEINMAYKTADWQRWQQLDFVVGIRISLSNNHTIKDSKGRERPFVDICDELAGDYPKQFKFTGWHPQCRCLVTPILQTQDEMRKERRERLQAIMNGKEYQLAPSRLKIVDLPQCFRDHITAIAERSESWASQPYYIRDNFKGGTIAGGLNNNIPQATTRLVVDPQNYPPYTQAGVFSAHQTSRGSLQISSKHGKKEKRDNISVGAYLANKYGYNIYLLDVNSRNKNADSYNKTLGVYQEYKVNTTSSISAIDHLLRKGAKQAEHIVLRIESNISLKDLSDAMNDRVQRTGIKTVTVIIDGKDRTFTREEIIRDGFLINKADLQ